MFLPLLLLRELLQFRCEDVHILGRAHHAARDDGQAADHGVRHGEVVKRRGDFLKQVLEHALFDRRRPTSDRSQRIRVPRAGVRRD